MQYSYLRPPSTAIKNSSRASWFQNGSHSAFITNENRLQPE